MFGSACADIRLGPVGQTRSPDSGWIVGWRNFEDGPRALPCGIAVEGVAMRRRSKARVAAPAKGGRTRRTSYVEQAVPKRPRVETLREAQSRLASIIEAIPGFITIDRAARK